MDHGRSITLDMPYEEAVTTVKETFKAHGFGTLTEIDVRATMAEKLGEEMEDYVILGICNPQLAHRALEIDRTVGLLLPCTVVVRAAEAGTIVDVLDPQVMVNVPGMDELQPIADEASAKIDAALEQLAH